MKGIYSHRWLQSFFDERIPESDAIAAGLMKHSFEVEGVEKKGDDTVYEMDILPDRSSDCLAHYGIAKEIGAIFSIPLARQYFQEQHTFSDTTDDYINTEKCDRYTILTTDKIDIEKIRTSAAYADIVNRLESIGQRSIHPIVDISNYILFHIGQPIHAFDVDAVSGKFSVRQAQEGEKIALLGGKEMSLHEEDIVITDASDNTPIALAGVKGGATSGVSESTKQVHFELATFDSGSIRRTIRRTGYTSDAAQRFSQGYPPEMIDYTAQTTAEILSSLGVSLAATHDCRRVRLPRKRKTGVSVSEVNALLGTTYTKEQVEQTLTRLNFPHEYIDPIERFLATAKEQVGVPYKWGSSVSRDAPDSFDCSSFVSYCAAQAGYSLPRISINQYLSTTPVTVSQPGDLLFTVSSDPNMKVRTERIFESGCPTTPGKTEKGINHISIMLDEERCIEAEGDGGANKVCINPLKEKEVIHTTRIWNDSEKRFVVSVPVERTDIQNGTDLIEEIGRMIGYDSVPVAPPSKAQPAEIHQQYAKRLQVLHLLTDIGFSEISTYSFQESGDVCVAYPVAKDKGCLRNNLHNGISDALKQNAYNGEALGLGVIRVVEIGTVFGGGEEKVVMALGARATLGRPKIDLGKIEQEVKEHLSLPGGFDAEGVWEVPFDEVSCTTTPHDAYPFLSSIGGVVYSPPSKYPFMLRDVAFFVPEKVSLSDAVDCVQASGGEHLKNINLFDSFVKDGKQSYALRLVFQSDEQTLDDESVNKDMEHIYEALRKKGCEVR